MVTENILLLEFTVERTKEGTTLLVVVPLYPAPIRHFSHWDTLFSRNLFRRSEQS